ncbi:MAG: radical SAM protein [Elusimicrobia bacterium]|nr:radical SAM protein [Elusimicrobiota bacterium]
MIFKPTQVLFAPTYQCNLRCAHCNIPGSNASLPISVGINFLQRCRQAGIKELGFTGGEPFLYPEFIRAVSREAVKLGFRFDRITTNAGWFKNQKNLERTLQQVIEAGYNGMFCVSIDSFHKVPLAKVARFIIATVQMTGRVEGISLVYVGSIYKVRGLARLMQGRISKIGRLVVPPRQNFPGLSAKITRISLCPIEKAGVLASPWSRKWFKEDFCQGPGQVLYVTPFGEVKPCCGFASDLPEMSLGNIYRQKAGAIIKKAQQDRFIKIVFQQGLLVLRNKYLQDHPQEKLKPTMDHCYFCWYMQKKGVRSCL